jgi:hypothetical protein
VQLSHAASLAPVDSAAHNHGRRAPRRRELPVDALRYSETINGRSYVIEVQSVGVDRWRADVARTTGGPTALMPFYGSTPDEAARLLAGWLTRASRRDKAV